MADLTPKPADFELTLLKLAREIAMDIKPVEDILKTLEITPENWETIQQNPYFQGVLRAEIEAWNAAQNTAERVKLKTLAMVEEALPEFYARMHDPKEPLPAKTDVLKTISKFAGIGGSNFDASMGGERLSVTINLGADQTLRIEKQLPQQVIEHEDVL